MKAYVKYFSVLLLYLNKYGIFIPSFLTVTLHLPERIKSTNAGTRTRTLQE